MANDILVAVQVMVHKMRSAAEEAHISFEDISWSKPNWKGDAEATAHVSTEADLLMRKFIFGA